VKGDRINVKSKATFYHAGCAVCVTAEDGLVDALDRSKLQVETVDLGQHRQRIAEAETAGVKSLPALVVDGQVFHINHGADLSVLK
jgi:glutaredoxin